MVARPNIPVRSGNAGEFSRDAAGRVDIKQYYSAGLAYKNIEPVPQGGFRQMGGSWRIGQWRAPLVAQAITGDALDPGPHTGTKTIWTGTVAGAIAAVYAVGLAISAGTATFSVQAQIAGNWTEIAGPFAVAAGEAATRLAAFAPGKSQVATALRIVATFSASATVSGLTVQAFSESGGSIRPRHVALNTDGGDAISCFVSHGIADFFTEDGFVGSARVNVTADQLPDLDFYAEGSTIGIFHGDLQTVRLFLATPNQLADWRVDLWPYDPVPKADLGGDYPKTDDVWEIMSRWSDGNIELSLRVTVNSEVTPDITVTDSTGTIIKIVDATAADWADFAARVAAAVEDLPSLGPTVSVTHEKGNGWLRLVLTFGGALSGEEYQVSTLITNTASASALAYHTTVGKTDLEDLFSASRGWPGTATLLQDRETYARIPAVSGALAMSRIGEYFDLNTDASTDNAARLDKLRSQTSETILHVKESNYIFVFTDRGVYFVPNRTIERNQPLNFVLASEIGAQTNCQPFELEGDVYYVAINPKGLPGAADGGRQLFRLSESITSASTSFNGAAVSLLATHLVDRIIRSARQKPETDLDASKGWLMRTDGRLIATQMIKDQEINGYCEWIAAAGGLVREIGVDGKNKLWLANERSARNSLELYDTSIFLQDAMNVSADLAGVVSDLQYEEGAQLWAVADGYVLGPFTVASGKIDLRDPYTNIIVGRWIAPRWESMPQVLVTPGDEVVMRPGRIHTLNLNLIDTTSIAVGANGSAPQDVKLLDPADLVDHPMPAKTMLLTVTGADLSGFMTGTTAVVTQIKPGELRVRDIGIGAKL